MPATYTQIFVHIIFSTKDRERWIAEDIAERLHAYMGGIIRAEGAVAMAIGGMDDHVHLLVSFPATITVAKLVQVVKAKSSKWVHDTFPRLARFAWQIGYAAFSVSESKMPAVSNYIANQREHHAKRDYRAELLAFLRAHEIEFDPRYVFD